MSHFHHGYTDTFTTGCTLQITARSIRQVCSLHRFSSRVVERDRFVCLSELVSSIVDWSANNNLQHESIHFKHHLSVSKVYGIAYAIGWMSARTFADANDDLQAISQMSLTFVSFNFYELKSNCPIRFINGFFF